MSRDRSQTPATVTAGITATDLELRFTYHPPAGDQTERYVRIRAKALELAELITASSKPSREQSLALTKLEEVVMWANAGIARNG